MKALNSAFALLVEGKFQLQLTFQGGVWAIVELTKLDGDRWDRRVVCLVVLCLCTGGSFSNNRGGRMVTIRWNFSAIINVKHIGEDVMLLTIF